LTTAPCDAQPIPADLQSHLIEPFVEALSLAFRECAATEVMPKATYRKTVHGMLGDLSAILRVSSNTKAALALTCLESTAVALTRRVLAESSQEATPELVRDCFGELMNVTAGQAKAILHATRHRFAFTTPQVVVGAAIDINPPLGEDCAVIAFGSEVGDLVLQIFLPIPTDD